MRDYNRRVQSFPSGVIARSFGFEQAEFFEVDEALREAGAPQVNFGAGPGGVVRRWRHAPDAGGTTTPPRRADHRRRAAAGHAAAARDPVTAARR